MSGINTHYNIVNEKVEVISHTAKGKINILRINWNNTVYKVTEVISEGPKRDGDQPARYYNLRTDRNVIFELRYEQITFDWILVKWDLDET